MNSIKHSDSTIYSYNPVKSDKIMLRFIIACFFLSNGLMAQTKIKGTYNAQTKTFATTDKTYWIGDFKEGYAPISNKGYYGFMDSTGKVLCKPKYDRLYSFNNGFAEVTGDNFFAFCIN